jgi:hypothetical protein
MGSHGSPRDRRTAELIDIIKEMASGIMPVKKQEMI